MKANKILVPISGNSADEEAIKLACKLAEKSKAKVYVLYIIEVERSLPLDAWVDPEVEKAEVILTHAEHIAADIGYDIGTVLLQAREAGPGIVGEAMEGEVDLIVMGVGYKKHLGEFDLGQAIPYVLKEAPCQVLLYREPIS